MHTPSTKVSAIRWALFVTLISLRAWGGDLGNAVAITAGEEHACALLASGGVKCWGNNFWGQLGNGSNSFQAPPGDVVDATSGFVAVSAGPIHTCAVTVAGGVKCWGDNFFGQLGDGTNVRRGTPVNVVGLNSGVVAVTAGEWHTCALMGTGTVKCWGDGSWGALGAGDTSTSTAVPIDASSMGLVSAISAGGLSTCAITAAGGVRCWGVNNPFFDMFTGFDIPGLATGVAAIDVGEDLSCAVMAAGGVKCWGKGRVGDGTLQARTAPVDVVGLASSVDAVAVGLPHAFGVGIAHTCARTTAGGVKCWGDGLVGETGQGVASASLLAPADVLGLSSGVAAIASGSQFSCAITSGGAVRCWGDNSQLQLGNPVNTPGVPVAVTIPATQQVLTFPPIPAHDLHDAPFTVNASASSGLPVTLAALTPSVCTLSGSTITLVSIGMCTIAAHQAGDSGYSGTETLRSFRVTGSTPALPARLANISTRGFVGTGENVLIGGFIVGGSAAKTIVVTATGPSLTAAGIANPLMNPIVSVYRQADHVIVASSDDWGAGQSRDLLQASGLAPTDGAEAGVIAVLAPGAYTMLVSGANATTGVAVVAVYEIDHPESPLINIATRANVQTGNDVMIAGFVIYGTSPRQVAITAAGPSLSAFGIANPLSNPTLRLVRQSDGSTVAANDDWQSASNASQLMAAGFAPADARESAIMLTLDPGAYTAIVEGVNAVTGVAVVGVYAVP